MAKFNLRNKWQKTLRILSKPNAYLQTMTKTTVKFQKNRYKTVGEVAPTRYFLSIHIVKDNARKMTKFKFRKSDKK